MYIQLAVIRINWLHHKDIILLKVFLNSKLSNQILYFQNRTNMRNDMVSHISKNFLTLFSCHYPYTYNNMIY